MDEVVWKQVNPKFVDSFPYLEVSNKGKARNIKTGLEYRGWKDKEGYIRIGIQVGKDKVRPFLLHRLIAAAFIPNPDNKPIVNHIDRVRDNNSIENLEWATVEENNSKEKREHNKTKSRLYYIKFYGRTVANIYESDQLSRHKRELITKSIREDNTYDGGKWLVINEVVNEYLTKYHFVICPEDFIYNHPENPEICCSPVGLFFNRKSVFPFITMSLSTGPYYTSKISEKSNMVHRIVYESYSQTTIPDGYTIDHIDSDPQNNHVANLRCVSFKENCRNINTRIKRGKGTVEIYNEAGELLSKQPNLRSAGKFCFGDYEKRHSVRTGSRFCNGYIIVYNTETKEDVFSKLIYKYNIIDSREELVYKILSAQVKSLVDTGKSTKSKWIYYTGKGNYKKFINEDGSSKV